MKHGMWDVTVDREKWRRKCGGVHIRKCDAVRGYTWNCTYCPRVFLPITSGKRPEQTATLRSVLGENIWQSLVGSDMPPGVTHEPLLLYLTMLWACLKFAVLNYRTISESWRAKDSEASNWMDWLSKNTNISLSKSMSWLRFELDTVHSCYRLNQPVRPKYVLATALDISEWYVPERTCQSDGLLQRNKQRSLTFQARTQSAITNEHTAACISVHRENRSRTALLFL